MNSERDEVGAGTFLDRPRALNLHKFTFWWNKVAKPGDKSWWWRFVFAYYPTVRQVGSEVTGGSIISTGERGLRDNYPSFGSITTQCIFALSVCWRNNAISVTKCRWCEFLCMNCTITDGRREWKLERLETGTRAYGNRTGKVKRSFFNRALFKSLYRLNEVYLRVGRNIYIF